jgi:hypothetical protein
MVTVSPLRLVHTWREQQEAKRIDVLAGRILAVMRRRQAHARTELLFSTELLTKSVGAEPAEVFRGAEKARAPSSDRQRRHDRSAHPRGQAIAQAVIAAKPLSHSEDFTPRSRSRPPHRLSSTTGTWSTAGLGSG